MSDAQTEAELQGKIDEIDEILDGGITQVTVDGITTLLDHRSLRKRRAELTRKLEACQNGEDLDEANNPFRPIQF